MMQLSPRSYKEHSIEGDAAGKTTPAVAKSSFCHEVAVALKRYSSLAFPVLFTLCVTHTPPPPLSLCQWHTHPNTNSLYLTPFYTHAHTCTHTHSYFATSPPHCVHWFGEGVTNCHKFTVRPTAQLDSCDGTAVSGSRILRCPKATTVASTAQQPFSKITPQQKEQGDTSISPLFSSLLQLHFVEFL